MSPNHVRSFFCLGHQGAESPKQAFLFPSGSFEKMISGLYLGETVRLLLLRLTDHELLFGGRVSEALRRPGSFPTKFMSDLEE